MSHISNPNLAAACENIGGWPLYPFSTKTRGSTRVAGITILVFDEKLITCGGQTDEDDENSCYFWQGNNASFMHFAIMSSFRSFGVAFVIDTKSFALIGGNTEGNSKVGSNTFDVYTKASGFQTSNGSPGVLPQHIENPCLVTFPNEEEMYLVANNYKINSFLALINRRTLNVKMLQSPPLLVEEHFSCAGQILQNMTNPVIIISEIIADGYFATQVFNPKTNRWTVLQKQLAPLR